MIKGPTTEGTAMPGSVWVNQVQHIRDGEAVDASVASRPDQALEARSNYLKARLDAAELGEGMVAHAAVLSPSVLEGHAVAWNPTAGRFEPALAEVATDPSTGAFVPSWRADCLGVVLAKTSATLGVVLTGGRAAADLSGVGVTAPGRYYLSAAQPGALTLQAPPVSVPVLYYDGEYAYAVGGVRSFLEAHVHHKFSLHCRPAGATSDPGSPNRHAISSPDPSLPGWLPAAHASFGGAAPAGAAFGYNLAAHPQLQRAWPPVPPSSAVLVWDRADASPGGAVIPMGTSGGGLCHVDRNGIWWMSDCYGDVPWPTSYNSASPPPPLGQASAPPTCPRPEEMKLHLWFAEMLVATDKTVVTSLAAPAGGPLRITNCDGDPASTGALNLEVDLAFLTDADVVDGSLVFKAIDGTTFKRGRVVESLEAGANVTLTPTVGTGDRAQGAVRIDVSNGLDERILTPQVVRVSNVRERLFQGVPYFGFPAGMASSVLFKYRIPPAGLPVDPHAVIRLWLFSQTAGTLPAVTAAYRRIPAASATPAALPTADTPVACNTNVAIGAGQYREVASDPIPAAAGDVLLVLLTRAAGDGFAGELGLVAYDASLVAG
jgi:hypothetical protein